jgi:hypothetical protein
VLLQTGVLALRTGNIADLERGFAALHAAAG